MIISIDILFDRNYIEKFDEKSIHLFFFLNGIESDHYTGKIRRSL